MPPIDKKAMMRGLLAVAIIAAGFLIMKFLIMSRKAPKKIKPHAQGILVETVQVNPADFDIQVRGTGTVQPRNRVDIVPEVSGKVISVSPRFIQGGIFSAGEELFRIEPVDYQVMLEKARAELAGAELNLEIEKTRGSIAKKEWQNIEKDPTAPEPPLTLRKPQMKQAEANLAAARAAVRQAEINLRRTRVKTPFNSVVKEEYIDIGQYVKQGTKVGTLTGTDVAEIIVPVSIDDLEFIKIPGMGGVTEGSDAVVSVKSKDRLYTWHGRAVRLLGDVDPKSRMFRVVVQVKEPFKCLDSGTACNVRLAEWLFVDVNFHCGTVHNVYAIRRDQVRDNETVWVMDSNSRLKIRKVNILRYQGDTAIIDRGLEPGDHVVITPVTGAADGMLLRTSSHNPGQQGVSG